MFCVAEGRCVYSGIRHPHGLKKPQEWEVLPGERGGWVGGGYSSLLASALHVPLKTGLTRNSGEKDFCVEPLEVMRTGPIRKGAPLYFSGNCRPLWHTHMHTATSAGFPSVAIRACECEHVQTFKTIRWLKVVMLEVYEPGGEHAQFGGVAPATTIPYGTTHEVLRAGIMG